jgi:hypothetical protein
VVKDFLNRNRSTAAATAFGIGILDYKLAADEI